MDRLYAPWRMAYVDQPNKDRPTGGPNGCIFCDKAAAGDDVATLILRRGILCYVLLNLFPYNNGHVMVAPYRHVAALTDLDEAETLELMTLAKQAQKAIAAAFHPQGYNLGLNQGAAAGAGIADHLHLHIVPRWHGDTNFMPVLGDVKVMPDSLENTAHKIRCAWPI